MTLFFPFGVDRVHHLAHAGSDDVLFAALQIVAVTAGMQMIPNRRGQRPAATSFSSGPAPCPCYGQDAEETVSHKSGSSE